MALDPVQHPAEYRELLTAATNFMDHCTVYHGDDGSFQVIGMFVLKDEQDKARRLWNAATLAEIGRSYTPETKG